MDLTNGQSVLSVERLFGTASEKRLLVFFDRQRLVGNLIAIPVGSLSFKSHLTVCICLDSLGPLDENWLGSCVVSHDSSQKRKQVQSGKLSVIPQVDQGGDRPVYGSCLSFVAFTNLVVDRFFGVGEFR